MVTYVDVVWQDLGPDKGLSNEKAVFFVDATVKCVVIIIENLEG